MMSVCCFLGGMGAAFATLYCLLEVNYFLRACFSVLLAKICKSRLNILDESRVGGICLTTDIDTFLYHMNNSRFTRELDFARADFYERTGLYKVIRKKGGSIAVAATTIRYRRFIKLFNRYEITSKVIYWDDQSIYMEHKFITPSDNFVNAVAICKTRLIDSNAEEVMRDLLNFTNSDPENETKLKPEMPLELSKWLEYNEISSNLLRNAYLTSS